jgi:L-cystine transport system permease protein
METRAFDPAMIVQSIPDLLAYLDITLLVGISSIGLGSALGLLLAWAKLGQNRLFRWAAHGYTYIMRCTPSIVLLFIVFYGLPELADDLLDYNLNGMNRAVFAIIAFALLFGAYISEVFRAAYCAVPAGQYEAAVSIGISPLQAFLRVMLPQAALIALPNFGNSVINLLKEGALAYTIGLIDLIGRGNLLIAQNFGAYGIEIYLACMLIYWVLTILIEQSFGWLERQLSKGRRPVGQSQSKKAVWSWLTAWLKRGDEAHGAQY